jgi:hypothetical protein
MTSTAESYFLTGMKGGTTNAVESERSNLRLSTTHALLMIYAFFAPLGNLARFGSGETEFGLTSVVLGVALIINLIPLLITTVKNRALLSLIVLACWMAISGLLSDDLLEAYTQLAGFLVYVLFAGLTLSVNWPVTRIRRLLFSFMLGGLISSALTLIDWSGLVNIPGVNELSIATQTELGSVMQASGPFGRRSAMAAYFALLIPIAILSALYVKSLSTRVRLFFATTGLCCAISLILTHNRAGLLGGLTAIGAISLYLARSPARLARALLAGAAGVLGFGWLIATYLPAQFDAYRALLNVGGVASTDAFLAESDKLRLVFFERTITALASNPIGHGYTMLNGIPGFERIDPHNMLSQIVWAAGLFGLLWIVYFGRLVFRRCKPVFDRESSADPVYQYGIAIGGGLLGWFFCGMAHTIIATGVSWLLFGILLRITRVTRSRHQAWALSPRS